MLSAIIKTGFLFCSLELSKRNYKREFDELLDFLCLKDTQELTIIDLGCGTGATSIYAMNRFKKIYGGISLYKNG
jgi:cyclopropane fatty-acyl-phospholipid synthase-like methyltransferase